MASVISKALKITGELESTEDIQIDGQIEGDVRGVGVKIGQNAKVKGTVYGDEVELAGTVEGKIESKKVILAGTARMTGDIWHQEIKVRIAAPISTASLEAGSWASPSAKPAHKTGGHGCAFTRGPILGKHRQRYGGGASLRKITAPLSQGGHRKRLARCCSWQHPAGLFIFDIISNFCF